MTSLKGDAGGSSLVDHARNSIADVSNKTIRKKKCHRRKLVVGRTLKSVNVNVNVNVNVGILRLQRLFLLCQDAFRSPGTVPSPTHVNRLCHILDVMKPEDVGLIRDVHFFKPKGVQKKNARVVYTTIYKCKDFSLCIFFLPEGAVIPLHNHPGMTVFSKLLLGTMHIKSYDWVDPTCSESSPSCSKLRLARLKANSIFEAPCDTSVLYPTSGGNIHEFRAITPCAVLDVIGPPYSKDDGRDSSYYKDTPCDASLEAKESGDGYAWLEEIEMPSDSEMDVIEYLGPKVPLT